MFYFCALTECIMKRFLLIVLCFVCFTSYSQSDALLEYRKEKAEKKAEAEERKKLYGDCKIAKDEVDDFTGDRTILTRKRVIGTFNGGKYIRFSVANLDGNIYLILDNYMTYCTSKDDYIIIKTLDGEQHKINNARGVDCGDNTFM